MGKSTSEQAHLLESRELTHIDAGGRARMVDVSDKPWTRRKAVARCRVVLGPSYGAPTPRRAVSDSSDNPWCSEDLAVARVAGEHAAKETSRLIPLCHSLFGSDVHVSLSAAGNCVEVESRAEVVAPTGVEMEALTACTVAGLTLLAVVLPRHPDSSIEALTLWAKSGGRSGTWRRTTAPPIPGGVDLKF